MFLRRLVLAALAVSTVYADGSGSGSVATVKPQCASGPLNGESPIVKPLAAVFGPTLVRKVFAFMTATPFGKVLVNEPAQTCIANMNGEVLGETIKKALESDTCKGFVGITDIPFINSAVMILGNASMTPTITDTLKFMKAIPSDQMDQFCSVYTDSLIPCLTSQLLPSLAVVRAKYSDECCDGWVDDVLANYGYTISGQITKFAQLFGDLMCSTQTPSFSGEGSQRCGYTWIQTIVTKPDEATTAASVLKNLQVPTDQMCLRAEGKAYNDVNGKEVEAATATQPIPSGCVTPLDRLTTWASGLPAAKRSQSFDVQALFANDECLNGADLFPLVVELIPELALDELKVYFSRSCVHLPTKFADKCSYSRPAQLIKWASEPSPVKETAAPAASEESGTTEPTSVSPEPSATSSAASVSAMASSVLFMITATIAAMV